MIIVASQRGGAYALADHLMNDRDNDHVELHDLKGFIADDLRGALTEAFAISKGTQCSQYLFSVSLSPPPDAYVEIEAFENAIKRIEQKLSLTDQPRAIVFHEKEGRRHAHVVWSRIDAESMTAINLPFFKGKLNTLSRDLYLEHEWTLPDGLRQDGGRSPLNFTMAEWQQAKRVKLDPREIKQSFQQAWAQSDSLNGFKAALKDKGYFLARGDRRGFVALNVDGEVFSLSRWTGLKTKDMKARLGDPDALPSTEETRSLIAERITDKLRDFIDQVDAHHEQALQPLHDERLALRDHHRQERQSLKAQQEARWEREVRERHNRIRKGLTGLWDRLTGRSKAIQDRNDKEAFEAYQRDRMQKERLIAEQLKEHQALQQSIARERHSYTLSRRMLAREIAQSFKTQARDQQSYQRFVERDPERNKLDSRERERDNPRKKPPRLNLTI